MSFSSRDSIKDYGQYQDVDIPLLRLLIFVQPYSLRGVQGITEFTI